MNKPIPSGTRLPTIRLHYFEDWWYAQATRGGTVVEIDLDAEDYSTALAETAAFFKADPGIIEYNPQAQFVSWI